MDNRIRKLANHHRNSTVGNSELPQIRAVNFHISQKTLWNHFIQRIPYRVDKLRTKQSKKSTDTDHPWIISIDDIGQTDALIMAKLVHGARYFGIPGMEGINNFSERQLLGG